MEQIRARAGASTGSLYHHFESKEVLAGELYLEGTRRVQEEGLSALLRHRSAERGIRAIVGWYLRWVQENPRFASYLFHHRHADFMVRDRRLERMNMKLRSDVTAWLARHIEAGELPKMGMEMYWAVLVGPSEFICRRRIREGKPREIARSARGLADAAWGAIVEIRDRQKGSSRTGASGRKRGG